MTFRQNTMVIHEKLGKMFDVQDILAALQKQTGLTKQDTQKLPRVRLAGLIQEMRCKWLHPWTCHKSHFEFSSGKSMRELLWKVRSAVGGACRHHHRLHHHLAETVLFSITTICQSPTTRLSTACWTDAPWMRSFLCLFSSLHEFAQTSPRLRKEAGLPVPHICWGTSNLDMNNGGKAVYRDPRLHHVVQNLPCWAVCIAPTTSSLMSPIQYA